MRHVSAGPFNYEIRDMEGIWYPFDTSDNSSTIDNIIDPMRASLSRKELFRFNEIKKKKKGKEKKKLTCRRLTIMQVLQTLRLMMVMMMGRSHCGAHRVVPMLMVRWAPSMRMVLGGMMLMRMIGGRQEARRRRINTRTVTGRPAERCCEQSMRNCVLYYLIWQILLPHFPPLILFQMNFLLYKYNINILYRSIRRCRKV